MKEKLNALHVITDDKLTSLQALQESVTKAINGGAKIVQSRDKISSDETIEETVIGSFNI